MASRQPTSRAGQSIVISGEAWPYEAACPEGLIVLLSRPAHPGASLFADEPSARWRLPDCLREVSGLAVTSDGRLMGHDDERAVIYELDLATGAVAKRFSLGDPVARGDFEGLAIGSSDIFYLVTSTGFLHRFREADDHAHAAYETFDTGLGQACEVEGVAFDFLGERVILAPKTNHAAEMEGMLALYAWSPQSPGQRARPWLTIPLRPLAEAVGATDFHPSALEIDPISGRLILVASHENAMVELDTEGQVLAARSLGSLHRQPEGAAILADGALVIADEAHHGLPHIARYGRLAP